MPTRSFKQSFHQSFWTSNADRGTTCDRDGAKVLAARCDCDWNQSELSLIVTGISDDQSGFSIQVVMDVWIVQILKYAVVIREANSCKQTSLDPVDH